MGYAKSGDTEAQFELGARYNVGWRVGQDYKEALKWYRLAADNGDVFAQNNLGTMYQNGEGVIQDFEKAYFWFLIATSKASKDYYDIFSENRSKAASMLTPSQQNKIQQEANAWIKDRGFE